MAVFKADRGDLGAFRFSDVERNLIVASTNLIGLNEKELESLPSKAQHVRVKDASAPSDVVILSASYKDGKVVRNAVKLELVVTA